MLRPEISEFVSYSAYQTLDDMIARAYVGEINMEHIGKRKGKSGQTVGFYEETQGI